MDYYLNYITGHTKLRPFVVSSFVTVVVASDSEKSLNCVNFNTTILCMEINN